MKFIKKLAKKRWALIALYSGATAIFIFLLFMNFYPIRGLFENSIFPSTKIYDRNGILLYETLHPAQGKTTAVSLDELPTHLIQATLSAEDISFYRNSGVDVVAVVRAFILNLKEGRIVSGGSTITQQLVRNVIGVNKKRTIVQKIKESFLALRVTKVFTKNEVLTMYLNKIYYGNLNYGISAASQGYFGKNVADLDLAESAFLAGLPQAPNHYDPFENREEAVKRKNYVLSLMHKHGFISQMQFESAINENLVFERNVLTIRAPHFVNFIIEQLEDRFGESFVSQGLEVKTTIDYYLHEKVEKIAAKNIALLAGRNVTNASVVILDPLSAEIIGMLGSVDYFNTDIDGAVNVALAKRQPGSAMKPITYALAFEKGWHGATLLVDEPVRFFTADKTPYLPKNYDFEYHGVVTVRESLANSYNIPAVKTINFTGVEPVLNRAHLLGLTTLDQPADHYGLALTLGDGEVRLLDLASAYMAFAYQGRYREPQAILEIKSSDGEVLYEKPNDVGTRVISPEITFLISDILSDNEARLSQFGLNNVLQLDHPVAAKTGTTRNFRDNWTLGYTPDFVVGVWVGNSDNSAMHDVSGIYGAGPIWRDVMNEIHRTVPKHDFKPPAGVEKKVFCIERDPAVTRDGLDQPLLKGDDEVTCPEKVEEWVVKDIVAGKTNGNSGAVSEKALIEIKKPFDLDEFEYNPNLDSAVQQIKFAVQKDPTIGQVTWYLNGEDVGKGDEIFWRISPGQFEIKAIGKSKDVPFTEIPSEIVRILVN